MVILGARERDPFVRPLAGVPVTLVDLAFVIQEENGHVVCAPTDDSGTYGHIATKRFQLAPSVADVVLMQDLIIVGIAAEDVQVIRTPRTGLNFVA